MEHAQRAGISSTDAEQKSDDLNDHQRVCCKWIPNQYKDELKIMLTLSWPIVASSFLEQLILALPLMFSGHLGKTEIGAVSLGSTIVNIFGLIIFAGISTACDTLFSQTYGSINRENLGILLQRALVINFVICVPVFAVVINTKHLLVAMGDNPVVASLGGDYTMSFMPAIPGFVAVCLMCKFLNSQGIVRPAFYMLSVTNIFHICWLYLLTVWTKLGVIGAGISCCISYWTCAAFHATYIYSTQACSETWKGWSWMSFLGWKIYLYLGLPGFIMISLPWICNEIFILFAGFLTDVELAAFGIIKYIIILTDVMALGCGSAVSVRVGNLLGEGDCVTPTTAYKTALIMSGLTSITISTLLICCGDFVASLFTNNRTVNQRVVEMLPLVAVIFVADVLVSVAVGVIRGTGHQKFGAFTEIFASYCISLPVGLPLMFKTSLGAEGCLAGIFCSLVVRCIIFLIKIQRLDWKQEAELADQRTKEQVVSDIELTEKGEHTPVACQCWSSDGRADADICEKPDTAISLRHVLPNRLAFLLVALFMLAIGITVNIELNFISDIGASNFSLEINSTGLSTNSSSNQCLALHTKENIVSGAIHTH